jgi:hypothetical protein
MRLSFLKRSSQLALALTLCVAVLGCSLVQVAYNQSERVAYWWLDSTFEFTPTQEEQVRAGLAQWFKWHRHTQLPPYAQFLVRAEKEALAPLSPALACTRRNELEAMGRLAIDTAVPPMASVALTLSPDQLRYLDKYLAKKNKEYREDYLQPDLQERQEATAEFVLKWTEFFYGDLDSAQEKQLTHDVAAMPINAQDVYDERLRLQREFVQLIHRLIAQHATQAQAEQALRAQFQEVFVPSNPAQRARLAGWIQSGCNLSAATHNRTTAEQREHVSDKLKSWEDDLRELAKQS